MPSLKFATAFICWLLPSATLGFAGVTSTLKRVAELTVSTALLEAATEPYTAEMLDVPAAVPVVNPGPDEKSRIVATDGSDEFHCTSDETSCWLLSLKVAVAVNCCVVPGAMEALGGAIATEDIPTSDTVSEVVALLPPNDAVTVALPELFPVASPEEETPTIDVLEDFQVTALVKSCLLPSV